MTNDQYTLFRLMREEEDRQSKQLQLVASENIPSPFVHQILQYSLMEFKTAEGYPGQRYHEGCRIIDRIEEMALAEAKLLFRAEYANVQVHATTIANQVACRTLIDPGDRVLSMELRAGGHLSHHPSFYQVATYGVDPDTSLIDYDHVRRIAKKFKPRLIIAGASSYPREIDFTRFRAIADEVGAYLLADIAHTAGFVAGNLHASPVDQAHITTLSTYKTLRGPRSGIILSGKEGCKPFKGRLLKDEIDKMLFPRTQGSPNMLAVAAKAACFLESRHIDFHGYIQQVLDNSRCLARCLREAGHCVVTGGTDTHMALIDVSKQGLTGRIVEQALEEVDVICNRNMIPFDREGPTVTSGIRLGTAFLTSRGFKESDMNVLAESIIQAIQAIKPLTKKQYTLEMFVKRMIQKKIRKLASKFPINFS